MIKLMLLLFTAMTYAGMSWGAEEENPERESLKGLTGVHVIVEDLDSDAKELGLTVAELLTKAELELRKANIRVMTKDENSKTDQRAYLYISIVTVVEEGLVTYNLSVKLSQRVELTNGYRMLACTWSTTSVGTVGASRIKLINTDALPGKIEKFANDFLAVNLPKQQ